MMNAMLISSNAPDNLWEEALLTTCFFCKIEYHIRKLAKHPMSSGKVFNLILNM